MIRPETRPEPRTEKTVEQRRQPKERSAPTPRRKRFDWKVGRQTIRLGERTFLVAILDVSPDGAAQGRYQDPDRAFVRATELADAGADMIEVSGASPTGGKPFAGEAEELRRVVPVLKRLRGALEIPLAVESIKAAVAEKAVEYGASVLHDPSGLIFEPALARIALKGDLGVILSHMRGDPLSWPKANPIKDANKVVAAELNASIARGIRDGLDRKRIVVDAGLGQGKRKEQDLQLLAYTGDLGRLEIPFSFGLSGFTSFIADPAALAAAVCAAVLAGAHIIRSHDFAAARAAAQLADSLMSA